MSQAQPFRCFIDGVDYGPAGNGALNSITGDVAGVDKIGICTITLVFPAAAGYTFVPTREVQVYIETYTGASHTGNNPLFGGFIKINGITVVASPSGVTTVTLQCQDYNVLLDAIITDVVLSNHFTIGSDTYPNQVASLVQQFQQNGHGAVASAIDATHDVPDICGGHVFPAVTLSTGMSLRQGMRVLNANAVAFNSALRPRFMLELVDNVSSPANVICAMVVYDAASLPSPICTFNETPSGADKSMLSVHKRTLDASMPLGNYVQSLWHVGGTQWVKVKTSEGTTSEATYYNPYLNGGLTGNKGPWKLPVIQDTQSTNDTQAQTVADLARFSHEFPRETFELEEDGTYIQQGQTVTLKTTNINANYEVTAVQFSFPSMSNSRYVRYSLTLGLPLLELFDQSNVDWTAAPEIFDIVPPNPPGAPSLLSNTYNLDTGKADLTVSYSASSSSDTRGYAILVVDTGVGTHYWFPDIGNVTQATVEVPSGIAFSLDVYAYDGAQPPNYSTSGGQITGVTASPTYYALTNPGFETINSNDATMPYAWTKSTTGTGAVQRDTAQHNSGVAAGKVSIGSGAGTAAIVSAQVTLAPSLGYQLLFFARSNAAVSTLTWTVTWYASDGVTVLGTSTAGVTPPNGSWGRFTNQATPAVNAAFYTLKFSTAGSVAYSIWVDTVFFQGQVGPGGLEPGVVTPAMLSLNPTSGTPVYIYDQNGLAIYSLYWNTTTNNLDIRPFNGDPGLTTAQGFHLAGGQSNVSTLDLLDGSSAWAGLAATINFSTLDIGNFARLASGIRAGDNTTPTANVHIKGSSAGAHTAPIKIDSGTLMTTPEVGATEYDGNAFYDTPVVDRHIRVLSNAPITTGQSWSNSNAESGALYTGSISANELKVGRKVSAKLWGRLANAGSGHTCTIRFKIANTTISTAILATVGGLGSAAWSAEFVFTVRSAGVSGTVWADLATRSNNVLNDVANGANSTVNTTAACDVTMTAQFSAAGAGDTINIDQGWMEFID